MDDHLRDLARHFIVAPTPELADAIANRVSSTVNEPPRVLAIGIGGGGWAGVLLQPGLSRQQISNEVCGAAQAALDRILIVATREAGPTIIENFDVVLESYADYTGRIGAILDSLDIDGDLTEDGEGQMMIYTGIYENEPDAAMYAAQLEQLGAVETDEEGQFVVYTGLRQIYDVDGEDSFVVPFQ